MKGGMVVRMRLNPKDCLAILDLMEVMGIDSRQKSFASCSSMAFSSLIEMARKMGVIKMDEDGFQYLNRMMPFMGEGNNKVKRSQSDLLWERAQHGSKPSELKMQPNAMRQPTSDHGNIGDNVTPSIDAVPEVKEIEGVSVALLMQELQSLMDIQDSGGTLTQEQQNRYNHLNTVLFS